MLSSGPDTGSHIVSSPQLWLTASGLYMTTIISSLLWMTEELMEYFPFLLNSWLVEDSKETDGGRVIMFDVYGMVSPEAWLGITRPMVTQMTLPKLRVSQNKRKRDEHGKGTSGRGGGSCWQGWGKDKKGEGNQNTLFTRNKLSDNQFIQKNKKLSLKYIFLNYHKF